MNLPGRFVLLRRSLAVSWPILAAHPLRTLLAVAGVAVGVASVTATAAAGRAAERRVVEKLRSLGTNSIVVNAAPVRAGAGARPGALLEARDAGRLVEECPAVEAAAAAVARTLLVKAEDRQAQTTVVGVAPEGLPLRNVAVRAGRAFDEDDERARRTGCGRAGRIPFRSRRPPRSSGASARRRRRWGG
jgi:ABC-type lipoprotein release transport system permease subunit